MNVEESHFPPLNLVKYGKDTQVRWAIMPENKLLIFVHGFYGSALDTWKGFPAQLALHKKVFGYDIVYFGYESVTLSADESANELHEFLNDILSKTRDTVNASLSDYDTTKRRNRNWTYSHVVLVGHSLGACVIRRAILNQLQGGMNPWPKETKVKMIFYAPAHGGARIFRLITAAALGFSLPGLAPFAKYFSPVLDDLEPKSDFLKDLREESNRLYKEHIELVSPLTFWVKNDPVVLNKNFLWDTKPFKRVTGVNHMTVCKPTGYGTNVRLLLEQLP